MKGKVGQRSHHVVIELCIVKFFIWNHTFDFKSKTQHDFEFTRIYIIIYLQNFQNTHWARACQFTPNISESRNWVKKVNIGCRKMNLKWLRVSRDSTTKQNGRKVRRKWTLFQFRVWGRILKAKTPNKVKATRLKSGFQKRISNYEPEVLSKNSWEVLRNSSYERRGRLRA